MRVVGALRVKNEARWIGEVLDALRPMCQHVFVMDDHSTDDTRAICLKHGAIVLPSPFGDLNEGRDKNWLLAEIDEYEPDWIVMVDGDEILEPGGQKKLLALMAKPIDSIRLRVAYLWDTREQVRTDGIYGTFKRGSAFRYQRGPQFKHGFHCSNVPGVGWRPVGVDSEVRLLHLGYLHREDRIRKYAWYNAKDPNNRAEDCYRHMVQGDIPEVPAHFRRGFELRHAGPLKLEPLLVEVAA